MHGDAAHPVRRCAALLVIALLVGCGGTPASSAPATAPAATAAGPGTGTQAPAASPGATQASGLPEPSLTDPTAIGAAVR